MSFTKEPVAEFQKLRDDVIIPKEAAIRTPSSGVRSPDDMAEKVNLPPSEPTPETSHAGFPLLPPPTRPPQQYDNSNVSIKAPTSTSSSNSNDDQVDRILLNWESEHDLPSHSATDSSTQENSASNNKKKSYAESLSTHVGPRRDKNNEDLDPLNDKSGSNSKVRGETNRHSYDESSKSKESTDKQICWRYLNSYCRYGSRCRYSHTIPGKESAMKLRDDRQVETDGNHNQIYMKRGLPNIKKNMCFMLAPVHMLATILTDVLCKQDHVISNLAQETMKCINGEKSKDEVRETAERLWDFSTKKWPKYNTGTNTCKQNDAAEFLTRLISENDAIVDKVKTTIVSNKTCSSQRCCQTHKNIIEDTMHIIYDLPKAREINLQQVADKITNNGVYECPECNNDGTETKEITKAPQLLILQVNRRSLDGTKIKTAIKCPSGCINISEHGKELRYKVCGVIIHKGEEIEKGHYVYNYLKEDKEKWTLIDDDRIYTEDTRKHNTEGTIFMLSKITKSTTDVGVDVQAKSSHQTSHLRNEPTKPRITSPNLRPNASNTTEADDKVTTLRPDPVPDSPNTALNQSPLPSTEPEIKDDSNRKPYEKATGEDQRKRICPWFLDSSCKYGNWCRDLHTIPKAPIMEEVNRYHRNTVPEDAKDRQAVRILPKAVQVTHRQPDRSDTLGKLPLNAESLTTDFRSHESHCNVGMKASKRNHGGNTTTEVDHLSSDRTARESCHTTGMRTTSSTARKLSINYQDYQVKNIHLNSDPRESHNDADEDVYYDAEEDVVRKDISGKPPTCSTITHLDEEIYHETGREGLTNPLPNKLYVRRDEINNKEGNIASATSSPGLLMDIEKVKDEIVKNIAETLIAVMNESNSKGKVKERRDINISDSTGKHYKSGYNKIDRKASTYTKRYYVDKDEPEIRKKKICRFHKSGQCKFGRWCWHTHEDTGIIPVRSKDPVNSIPQPFQYEAQHDWAY